MHMQQRHGKPVSTKFEQRFPVLVPLSGGGGGRTSWLSSICVISRATTELEQQGLFPGCLIGFLVCFRPIDWNALVSVFAYAFCLTTGSTVPILRLAKLSIFTSFLYVFV